VERGFRFRRMELSEKLLKQRLNSVLERIPIEHFNLDIKLFKND